MNITDYKESYINIYNKIKMVTCIRDIVLIKYMFTFVNIYIVFSLHDKT